MPQSVNVPGVGLVRFPDNFTPDQMRQAINAMPQVRKISLEARTHRASEGLGPLRQGTTPRGKIGLVPDFETDPATRYLNAQREAQQAEEARPYSFTEQIFQPITRPLGYLSRALGAAVAPYASTHPEPVKERLAGMSLSERMATLGPGGFFQQAVPNFEETAQNYNPIFRGTARAAMGIADPVNLALLAGTGGLGIAARAAGAGSKLATGFNTGSRIAGGVFGAQAGIGAYEAMTRDAPLGERVAEAAPQALFGLLGLRSAFHKPTAAQPRTGGPPPYEMPRPTELPGSTARPTPTGGPDPYGYSEPPAGAPPRPPRGGPVPGGAADTGPGPSQSSNVRMDPDGVPRSPNRDGVKTPAPGTVNAASARKQYLSLLAETHPDVGLAKGYSPETIRHLERITKEATAVYQGKLPVEMKMAEIMRLRLDAEAIIAEYGFAPTSAGTAPETPVPPPQGQTPPRTRKARKTASETVTEPFPETGKEEFTDPYVKKAEARPAGSPLVPVANGAEGTAYTVKTKTPFAFRYQVHEAANLIPSHDLTFTERKGYDQRLQDRDRSSQELADWVREKAATLNPDFLGESVDASNGAPIMGPDGMIEGGNGRTMAVMLAALAHPEKYAAYRASLVANADKFGIDSAAVLNAETPILVRARVAVNGNDALTDDQRIDFARDIGASPVASMSAVEKARAEADSLARMGLLKTVNGQPPDAGSRSFLKRFLNSLSAEERQGLVDKGEATIEGIARARRALFAYVVEDPFALEGMLQNPDSDVKNVGNAIGMASGKLASLKYDGTVGEAFPMDIGPYLTEAVNLIAFVRGQGIPLEDYLAQPQMLEEFSPEARLIASGLNAAKRSAAKMQDFLLKYEKAARSYGKPNEPTLSVQAEPPTVMDALLKAQGMERAEETAQGDIFGDMAGVSQTLGSEGVQRLNDRESKPAKFHLIGSDGQIMATTDNPHMVTRAILEGYKVRPIVPTVAEQGIESNRSRKAQDEMSLVGKEPERTPSILSKRGRVVLTKTMYDTDIALTSTKELVQNAIDALELEPGKFLPDGRVRVGYSEAGKALVVSDNGVGMLPSVVRGEFNNIGDSYKPGGARGSFGMAKAQIFGNATEIQVESVAAYKGQKIKTVGVGSGGDWQDPDIGLSYQSVIVPDDTPTGTSVVVRYAPEQKFDTYDVQGFLDKMGGDSLLPVRIESVWLSDDSLGRLIGRVERPDEYEIRLHANPFVMKKAETHKFPGAKVEIYLSEEDRKLGRGWQGKTSYTYKVLNDSLFQFGSDVQVPAEITLPTRVMVNVIPTVDPGQSGDYPFTTNREALRGEVKEWVEKYIGQKLAMTAAKAKTDTMRQAFAKAPKVGNFKIMDTAGDMPDDFLGEVGQSPSVRKLMTAAEAIYRGLEPLYDTIYPGEPKAEVGGIGLGKYRGLYVQRGMLTDDVTQKDMILPNPFYQMDAALMRANLTGDALDSVIDEEGRELEGSQAESILGGLFAAMRGNPAESTGAVKELDEAFAHQIVGTIIHEMAHRHSMEHSTDFGLAMTELSGVVASPAGVPLYEIARRVASVGRSREFVDLYRRYQNATAQSAGGNIFGRASVEHGPAEPASGGSAGGPAALGAGGGRPEAALPAGSGDAAGDAPGVRPAPAIRSLRGGRRSERGAIDVGPLADLAKGTSEAIREAAGATVQYLRQTAPAWRGSALKTTLDLSRQFLQSALPGFKGYDSPQGIAGDWLRNTFIEHGSTLHRLYPDAWEKWLAFGSSGVTAEVTVGQVTSRVLEPMAEDDRARFQAYLVADRIRAHYDAIAREWRSANPSRKREIEKNIRELHAPVDPVTGATIMEPMLRDYFNKPEVRQSVTLHKNLTERLLNDNWTPTNLRPSGTRGKFSGAWTPAIAVDDQGMPLSGWGSKPGMTKPKMQTSRPPGRQEFSGTADFYMSDYHDAILNRHFQAYRVKTGVEMWRSLISAGIAVPEATYRANPVIRHDGKDVQGVTVDIKSRFAKEVDLPEKAVVPKSVLQEIDRAHAADILNDAQEKAASVMNSLVTGFLIGPADAFYHGMTLPARSVKATGKQGVLPFVSNMAYIAKLMRAQFTPTELDEVIRFAAEHSALRTHGIVELDPKKIDTYLGGRFLYGPGTTAWNGLHTRALAMIYRWGRKEGLPDAKIADAMHALGTAGSHLQPTLQKLARQMGLGTFYQTAMRNRHVGWKYASILGMAGTLILVSVLGKATDMEGKGWWERPGQKPWEIYIGSDDNGRPKYMDVISILDRPGSYAMAPASTAMRDAAGGASGRFVLNDIAVTMMNQGLGPIMSGPVAGGFSAMTGMTPYFTLDDQGSFPQPVPARETRGQTPGLDRFPAFLAAILPTAGLLAGDPEDRGGAAFGLPRVRTGTPPGKVERRFKTADAIYERAKRKKAAMREAGL